MPAVSASRLPNALDARFISEPYIDHTPAAIRKTAAISHFVIFSRRNTKESSAVTTG